MRAVSIGIAGCAEVCHYVAELLNDPDHMRRLLEHLYTIDSLGDRPGATLLNESDTFFSCGEHALDLCVRQLARVCGAARANALHKTVHRLDGNEGHRPQTSLVDSLLPTERIECLETPHCHHDLVPDRRNEVELWQWFKQGDKVKVNVGGTRNVAKNGVGVGKERPRMVIVWVQLKDPFQRSDSEVRPVKAYCLVNVLPKTGENGVLPNNVVRLPNLQTAYGVMVTRRKTIRKCSHAANTATH